MNILIKLVKLLVIILKPSCPIRVYQMLAKIIIIFILFAIFFALGSSLYYLVKDGNQGLKTVKMLTWRILLTIGLFIFLGIASHLGWIQPHDILPSGSPHEQV